ncbi:pyrimidodiazepine synthase-like [Orussus abietinus]|uniref:pyrimidodiazepine synthase-like n=1 Tax=Orussus abietinus TaxID=222816 RepID=UPI000625E21A|nr:pyrimidodiazepine synthase-like [Orussus abietinus]XP_012279208.1 pyrimidodiazepine synthase-like [Orussus abietinus]
MSSLHLAKGSENPPKPDEIARLYSMKFCPFAHRIRLILSYKKVPHDIVNINLMNKPEWYFSIHPEGKVPAFVDTNGTVVTDSLIIANYLDDKYPNPPLYNDTTKDRDKELIQKYDEIIEIFSKCIHNKDKRPLDEIIEDISNHLIEFEQELVIRGTTYFGGEKPGILDIMMWPWAERGKALRILYDQPLTFDKTRFPQILKWVSDMKEEKFVQENAASYERFAQLIQSLNSGSVDFDAV